MVPAGHSLQAACPCCELKNPAAHLTQLAVCSEEPPAGNRNKEAGSNRVQAEEEMNRYVENLKKAGRWPIDLSKVQGLNYENFEKVQISSEYVDFFTFLF